MYARRDSQVTITTMPAHAHDRFRDSDHPSVESPHDLRDFFRAVGSFHGDRALLTNPENRPDAEIAVELLDEPTPVPLEGPALVPAGFVDGIQAALQIAFHAHRPVYLNYVAAGALAPDGTIVRVKEAMFASGSFVDKDWFDGLGTRIPWRTVPAHRPDEIPADALEVLSTTRDEAERLLVEQLSAQGRVPLVVDGSLATRPPAPGLVGIVKTNRRRYLPDESLLWGMPEGYRSPRFKLPAGSQACHVDRYSCYVRLHDASRRNWDFGLIRLEAFDPELLEPLGVMALSERQSSRSRDARFDRHIAGVRAVEDVLRAHRPAVFSL